MMTKLKFYLLDADYITRESGKAAIRLFGRTADNKRVCCLDSDFEPYFYAAAKEKANINELLKSIKEFREGESFVTNITLEYKKDGNGQRKVLKVFVNHPRDVPMISKGIQEFDEVEKICESDILFVRRYLVDKKIMPSVLCEASGILLENALKQDYGVDMLLDINQVLPAQENLNNLRALSFDIETYTSNKNYPNSKHDPVICLSFYGDEFQKIITWKKIHSDLGVAFVKNEEGLIKEFVKTIKEYKPDCLVGYFSDGFDIPYLLQRARIYGISLDIGIDGSAIKTSRQSNEQRITGIPHVDLLKFIKGIMGGSLHVENFSLDEVANCLIGEKKMDFDIENIGKIWDSNSNSINEILQYNLKDAEITYKLFNAVSFDILELARLVGQPIDDVIRMHFGQLVEWYLIKRAGELNILAPNKPKFYEKTERLSQSYQGAFVYQPTPGLFKNLAVFDFKSLYPSIIISHNIDPGTLAKEKKDAFESPEITNEYGTATRFYFTKAKEGFIPLVIKDIVTKRGQIKKELKKKKDNLLEARSYMLKIIANAAYGMLGYSGARWYSNECAAAITAFGRFYVLKTIDFAKISGFDVAFSDTDSVAIILGKKTKEDALKFMHEVNESLPDFMELELEDFYKLGIFVAKKNEAEGAKKKYALINEKDELKIRGFETIRRDWSYLAKEVQLKVFEVILKDGSVEDALKYVRDVINKIRKKKIDIIKMVIRTQLRKDLKNYSSIGPHVKVAEKMKKVGIPVCPGTIINYVVAEGKGMVRDRAKLLDECKSDEYDAEYYINNQVIPAVKSIFEASGYTEEILKENKEQSKLNTFFGG